MTALYRFDLSKDVVVVVDSTHTRVFSNDLNEKIDAIWEKSEPSHFQSPIVSLVEYSPTHLIGELVDFSAWYASMHDPLLRKTLDIHPLAVTGRTIWRDKILVGKRALTLASLAGAMECCPSGSIDLSSITADGACDLRRAIFSELENETGIFKEHVQSVDVVALYLSTDNGVFDIQLDMHLKPDVDLSILTSPHQEYDELLWLEKGEIRSACSSGQWVPLSLRILDEAFS